MKLDMTLVREILDYVEDRPAGELIQSVAVNCDDLHTVAEHLRLMIDEGLLDGEVHIDREQGSRFLIEGLTWSGHELLQAIRNETVWKKVSAKATAVGGGLTLAIAKELGQQYLKELFGLK